jgi:hypothetical protein
LGAELDTDALLREVQRRADAYIDLKFLDLESDLEELGERLTVIENDLLARLEQQANELESLRAQLEERGDAAAAQQRH